jgi:hypothetical protein
MYAKLLVGNFRSDYFGHIMVDVRMILTFIPKKEGESM